MSLPGWDRQVAETAVESTHKSCPYSKATRGNIDIVIAVVPAALGNGRASQTTGGNKRNAGMTGTAIQLGDVMDSAQRHKPFGNATAGPVVPVQGLASRVIAGMQYEEPARVPEGWQDQLRSLEQWVCELLIKNQELRMALDSVKAQERRDGQGI